jgi:histone-lysine N-methyltransferase SUV39H
LRQGEFIDTYRGEVITDEEAKLREETGDKDKDSYLFSLDKFLDENGTCYVVDGQHFGGPSRFINHSCDPNCGIYTVSYDKNNTFLYELAFFAIHDIAPGEELTFDYKYGMEDKEQQGEDVENDSIPCRCESRNCRKWLWK